MSATPAGHDPHEAPEVPRPAPLAVEGQRVRLRDWRADDLPVYEQWIMPPPEGGEHEWQRTDGPFYPNFAAESAQRWLGRLRARVEAQDWPALRDTAVIAEQGTDRFLGQVSWYHAEQPTEDPGTGTYLLPLHSIGISLYPPEFWSGGYGSEALRLWVDLIFRTSSAHRVDLETWSGNRGMCRVAQKLGFQEEARIRQARIVGGVLHDRLIYGVLRSEWESARSVG